MRDGGTLPAPRLRSGSSEAYADTTGMTSVSWVSGSRAGGRYSSASTGSTNRAGGGSGSASGSARCRAGALAGSVPVTLAIRSATVTPSVWLPVGLAPAESSDSELVPRSHGAAPSDGRGVRVSQWLSSPGSDRRRRPGVALSPSLMSYRPPTLESILRVRAHIDGLRAPCLVAALCVAPPGAVRNEIHIVLRHSERRNV